MHAQPSSGERGLVYGLSLGSNRNHIKQSTNADQKSLETVFSIAICRQSGDKWQSKVPFHTFLIHRSSIVLAFSIAACHDADHDRVVIKKELRLLKNKAFRHDVQNGLYNEWRPIWVCSVSYQESHTRKE